MIEKLCGVIASDLGDFFNTECFQKVKAKLCELRIGLNNFFFDSLSVVTSDSDSNIGSNRGTKHEKIEKFQWNDEV